MAKKSKGKRRKPGADPAPAANRAPASEAASSATGSEKTRPASAAPGRRWRQPVLAAAAAISGVMWFLACADFDIWPLAWIAMVPALFAIERAPTMRRAVLFGWLTGLVANVGGFYWIVSLLVRFGHLPIPLAVLGLLLLCGYQAVVFALFAWVYRSIREHSAARLGSPLPAALVAPIVMVAFEILVPFIFPWYLAITQAWVTPVIQIADITGPVGVSALLLAVGGAAWDVLTETAPRRRWIPAASAAAAVALALVYGAVRMSQVDAGRADAPKLKVGVVQGNIPFDEKGTDRADLAMRQLVELQKKSAELEQQGARFIMWSETAYPYVLPRDLMEDLPEGTRGRIRRGFESPLMMGALTKEPLTDRPPWNTAIMIDRDGRFSARFDKIFLLMFGEYIPLADTFDWVKDMMPKAAGHLSRGDKITMFPLELDGVTYRLGPMICYEDILTDFSRELGKGHPHLLVNITNDAWFGDTSEPWEHLALSVYRAVELRTDLVRSVNTGVSAFVDASGRVFAKTYAVDPKITPKPVDGIVGEVALVEGGHTFYAKFGDIFGYLCAALMLAGFLVWPRVRRRK